MKLKLSEYRTGKDTIIKVYNNKGLNKATEAIINSGIPLVAGYTYIMEEFPEEDLTEKIKSLTKFYNYSSIEE